MTPRLLGLLLLVLVAASLASSAGARATHYAVTVVVSGPGRVSGTGNGGTIDCPGSCSVLIQQQTSITLAARADGGAEFRGWGGDCAAAGTAETCTLTVDGAKSVTAGFDQLPPPPPPRFSLTVTKAGTGSGYVGGGGGIDCGPACTASVTKDERVTLLAVADDGSRFAGWGGACTGTGPCALQMEADTQVTATFDHVDRDPPHVSTLRATARRGERVALRFKVWDDSGSARAELTILDGPRRVAAIEVPLRPVLYRHVYQARWRVPAGLAPGVRRFCAVGVDAAGNRSRRSCSALVVT